MKRHTRNLVKPIALLVLFVACLSLQLHAFDTAPAAVRLSENVFIDSLAVHKSSRELLVFSNGKLLKTYRVCLGLNPVGGKQVSGDYKTPEGLYYIAYHNPNSLYHKSMAISYPNAADIARAKKMGKTPGGDIMIHGLPNYDANVGPDRYQNDWTWGCIVLRNEEIDELFTRVQAGTPILITP